MQNIPKEKVLEVVRQGPTIPQKIVKIVGGDTMLIGAILSTMISIGEVNYSSLKIGGSPLYYIPEHEEKLEEFMNYLNEKDQKTAKLLKEKNVLKDSDQDPLIRFSLKTIRDFAKPFEIEKQLFYRYFLFPKEDAESIAAGMLTKATPKVEVKVEEKPIEKIMERHTEKTVEQPKAEVEKPKIEKPKAVKHEKKSDFLEAIKDHIHKLNLDIISKEKIKKSEFTLILKNHDSNEYIYCVAKDKKTIDEGDLSTAFVFSHQKKMPCLFLITGKLTKKAEAMSQKEFKEMKIEKMD
ncbi:TPA: hypothetical protein HA235_05650 [Candidatus Woesearchaeota archaeon]|nr:hypothetical protein [Candidatus Woesearchaeota archaeon]HIH32166.1 hypothetical protein [Candidatus Woesearchaeota archaeon]HIH55059.1 hypothetical protein [Candidatus Woesearchaeota archaeon]HIJ02481.1 hypothetical protein [Candidatus Woesearchaeota archaeon]HIJ14639.1 hypothetical protein [Candidatus Woesearchaeota archaeon]